MTLHLACIAEGDSLRHTGAMLHSALQHTTQRPLTVHLLHGQPYPAADSAHIRSVVEEAGAELNLLPVTAERAATFRDSHFPRAIWYRILLPELLPAVDRVLYLDSDIIVGDDLAPLWHMPLEGNWLGAVCNPFYPFMPDYPVEALGFASGREYFNSGVLLLDLAALRAAGAVAPLVDYARRHPQCAYPDQDALNVVCRGRWKPLHPRWNAQSTIFELPAHSLPFTAEQVAQARSAPAVVHYIGPFKPWSHLCRHPLRARYFAHAAQTPWGVPAIADATLRNRILRLLPLRWIDRWMRLERLLRRPPQLRARLRRIGARR